MKKFILKNYTLFKLNFTIIINCNEIKSKKQNPLKSIKIDIMKTYKNIQKSIEKYIWSTERYVIQSSRNPWSVLEAWEICFAAQCLEKLLLILGLCNDWLEIFISE